MAPQEAEVDLRDILDWYSDRTDSRFVLCSVVEPRGAVWIVPVFGKQGRVAVSVRAVALRVRECLDALALQGPLDEKLETDAKDFLTTCEPLIQMCADCETD